VAPRREGRGGGIVPPPGPSGQPRPARALLAPASPVGALVAPS